MVCYKQDTNSGLLNVNLIFNQPRHHSLLQIHLGWLGLGMSFGTLFSIISIMMSSYVLSIHHAKISDEWLDYNNAQCWLVASFGQTVV